MTIDDRLAQLEHDLHRLRRSTHRWRGAAMVLLAGGALLAADAGPTIFDHVVVRRLDLVGDAGTPLVSLSKTDGGGRLDLYANDGVNLLRLSTNTRGADIALWDRAGTNVAGLWSGSNGGAMTLWDDQGTEHIRADTTGLMLSGASLILSDGNAGTSLSAGAIELRNAQAIPVLGLSASDGAGHIEIATAGGTVIGELRGLPDVGGAVVLQTVDGKKMVLLAAAPDGGRFNLMNSRGVPVVIASTGEDGSAGAVSVANERGLPVVTLGADLMQRGELVVRDADGKNARKTRPMRGFTP
ncbi:MAG: hypothetical protein QGG74_03225 [Phycisphaerales bacterium]|nr:hypothetical protein [Phycisphaerales bacterium]